MSEQATPAPAVVAVVVTRNPGVWFDDGLRSLDAQTYPNLSILVVDAGSDGDVRGRVGGIVPSAYVRRLDENTGYGVAANEVVGVVDGAAFYLFCHDDVALADDAVRILVEEAYRSNAGIVGPKIVDWADERVLLQVGMGADKTGYPSDLVDRGELDQEQHDAVRDVFYVPGGCTLVRADLFDTLQGYDPDVSFHADDLDLCWRAHVAGARVLVAPGARVRHLEALGERRPVDDRRRLQSRHRLRAMLVSTGRLRLIPVLLWAVFIAAIEVVYALVVGRTRQARDIVSAWAWNLRRLGSIRARRKQVRSVRRVRDGEVRRFQVRGSARFNAFVRGQIGKEDDRLSSVTSVGRGIADSLRAGPRRASTITWVVILVALGFGGRHLLTREIPPIGEFAMFPDSPWSLMEEWASGWRDAGVGSEAPAPTGYALLGGLGYLLAGAMGLVRRAVFLGPVLVGILGMWRSARPLGSHRARIVATVVYATIPVPYNAVAGGGWSALIAYAVTPFLLLRMYRATAIAPYDDARPRTGMQQVIALGFLVAVAVAIAPATVVVVALVAVSVPLGSIAAGRIRGGRAMGVALGAVFVAAVLHLPWTFDFLVPGADWLAVVGPGASEIGGPGWPDLIRFDTGPFGHTVLGWALLGAGTLPLLVGRDWRFEWAVRAWVLALSSWAVAWLAQETIPIAAPPAEVLLVPAACGLSLAVALGMVAFERDVPVHGFGWRQVVAVLAAGLAVVAALPAALGLVGGRWSLPRGGFDRALAFLDQEQEEFGPFRVLWIGDSSVLPLAGWELDDDIHYGFSHGLPDVTERWAGSRDTAVDLVPEVLDVAARRGTNRLGRLLAPMGVRYVVLPRRPAPVPFSGTDRPVPPELVTMLEEQLDLAEIAELNSAYAVYRNDSWIPERAIVPADAGDGAFFDVAPDRVASKKPVLDRRPGFASYRGAVPGDGVVYHAAGASDRWRLTVDGQVVASRPAFGFARAYPLDAAGGASLTYRTSAWRYVLLVAQVALWLVGGRFLLRWRFGEDEIIEGALVERESPDEVAG